MFAAGRKRRRARGGKAAFDPLSFGLATQLAPYAQTVAAAEKSATEADLSRFGLTEAQPDLAAIIAALSPPSKPAPLKSGRDWVMSHAAKPRATRARRSLRPIPPPRRLRTYSQFRAKPANTGVHRRAHVRATAGGLVRVRAHTARRPASHLRITAGGGLVHVKRRTAPHMRMTSRGMVPVGFGFARTRRVRAGLRR